MRWCWCTGFLREVFAFDVGAAVVVAVLLYLGEVAQGAEVDHDIAASHADVVRLDLDDVVQGSLE